MRQFWCARSACSIGFERPKFGFCAWCQPFWCTNFLPCKLVKGPPPPPPARLHHLQADVTCTQPELGAGAVKVIVVGSGQHGLPLMTANVKMPFSEPDD
jgi:hypothetical protein